MRLPCEYIAASFLPNLRHRVAILLRNKGLSQVAIAAKLGVKQPVIASYLKRPIVRDESGILDDYLDQLAAEIADMLYDNQAVTRVIATICQSCKKLRVDSVVCSIHKKMVPELKEVKNCSLCLDTKMLPSIDQRSIIINQLNSVLERLKALYNITSWIPEIGSQLACCEENAKQFDDVASFPGRIIKVRDEILAVRSPEFGASRTMSRLLLWIRQFQKDIRWTISLKNRPELKIKLEKNNIPYLETRELDINWDQVLKELETNPKITKLRAILDEGGKGYEAIAYIFAKDSNELMEIISGICDNLF